MKYDWIDDYCISKKGTEKDYKPGWDATRYMIKGKMYAMLGMDKEGRHIITIKTNPMNGIILRSQYKDIIEGYYMNKEHWNSVYMDGDVPDDILRDMLDESYHLIYNSLNKKVQRDILESGDNMASASDLYNRILIDKSIQKHFVEAMDNAEREANELIRKRLVEFAREIGFSVSAEEIVMFFADKEDKTRELGDEELDFASGGTNLFTESLSQAIKTLTRIENRD